MPNFFYYFPIPSLIAPIRFDPRKIEYLTPAACKLPLWYSGLPLLTRIAPN
ncbi:hypothetical protein SAMN05216315_1281 [Nitrosospira sp. Nsp18]|nr:hypothetical protein SAMN05216315_1281 [Nitrosospira sp. Nsp18]